jgi:hypothetical protein
MFEYDYHCLIDNKCLRTHLLFHLYLEYNNSATYKKISYLFILHQSSWSKGISETKSKQQSQCSNCMHRPVTSQADACTLQAYVCMYCMHCLLQSQADACSLLHGLCCFDFILDILLSPATLFFHMWYTTDI